MPDPVFDRIAIIGIGLIGSSVALAARAAGLAGWIGVSDSDPHALETARELALGDGYDASPAMITADADLVVVAVPVGACGAVGAAIRPALKPGAIVTDTGSVKRAVISALLPLVPAGVHLIPGHPVAGTEQSGPRAGFATLFQDRWHILTPLPGTDPEPVRRLEAFWRGCGATVETMDPDHHDRVLAITSHLPHLIAYNIVGTVAELEDETKTEVIKFSASGFRDFTRIAASDPTMWRDVFLNNREAVLEMIGRFSEDLTTLQKAIRKRDGDALFALFSQTRDIRRGIIDAGQEIAEPDFGRHLGKPGPD